MKQNQPQGEYFSTLVVIAERLTKPVFIARLLGFCITSYHQEIFILSFWLEY